MKGFKLGREIMELLWHIRRYPWSRHIFFLVTDVISLLLSIYLAFLLRFEDDPASLSTYIQILAIIYMTAVVTKLPIYWMFRLYNISWSFASIGDALQIAVANVFATMAFYTGYDFIATRSFMLTSIPRSVFVIDFLLSLALIGLARFSKRLGTYTFRSFQAFRQNGNGNHKNILIIGAGNAGEQLVRSLIKDGKNFRVVGIIDDNPSKWNTLLHGVRIIGGRDIIKEAIEDLDVDSVIIAIPSASGKDVREFVNLSREAGVTDIKILPSIAELVNGTVNIRDIRDISVADLLGREQISIEMDMVNKFLKGKVVLVTGASGSIGEELCRQVARFEPSKVILFEVDETRLFDTHRELQYRFPNVEFVPVLADVRDREKTMAVFMEHKPDVVFHAAAYKHVPMIEAFPEEGVKTNIIGTYNVGMAAINSGVEKFVFISTDKAVNPTSAMGASKRIGEMIILALNEMGDTKFIAVRFGNVLGSRGSVVPIFKEQIQHGGPVTVTHPDMKRYFMTIPEAVLLVLQASAMGEGGEVFVLDMGEPVKIVDIAREMITLMGYKPDVDIPIVFTGVRPGEKLFEELLTAEEGTEATKHHKIFKARLNHKMSNEELMEKVFRLHELANGIRRDEIIYHMMEIIPSYRPNRNFGSSMPEVGENLKHHKGKKERHTKYRRIR